MYRGVHGLRVAAEPGKLPQPARRGGRGQSGLCQRFSGPLLSAGTRRGQENQIQMGNRPQLLCSRPVRGLKLLPSIPADDPSILGARVWWRHLLDVPGNVYIVPGSDLFQRDWR